MIKSFRKSVIKQLQSYVTHNKILCHVNVMSLLLFSCLSFAAQATPPAFSMAFSPNTIGSGNESLLTYTIQNSDSTGVRELAFNNTLPTGVTVTDPARNSTTCSDATLSAVPNSTLISFSGGALSANSTCTVSVYVTASTPTTYTNTTSSLTSNAGNSGTANDDLIVDADLVTFAMVLSPSAISQGEISTLTIDIVNPAFVGFTNNTRTTIELPSGLEVAQVSNLSSTCNTYQQTIEALDSTISLSLDWLNSATPPFACNVTVDIVNTGYIGEIVVSSSIQDQYVDVGSASASIDVARAFGIMSVNPNPVTAGASALLSITLTNYERSEEATNISFSNDLNAALTGLVATGLPLSNVCGSGSSLTGTTTISLSGGSLSPEASCTIEVPITVPANANFGTYTNTTSTFSLDVGGNSVTKNPVSSSFTVTNGPQVAVSFRDASYLAGSEALVDFTITNIDTVNSATNIALSSSIKDFIGSSRGSDLTTLPTAGECGGASFTEKFNNDNDYSFDVSGGSLAAGANCTFTLGITLPETIGAGTYQLTASNITSTINSVNVSSTQVTDSIAVISAPSLALSIVEDYSAPSGTINAEFTLTHSLSASTNATDIDFTIDLGTAITGVAYAGAAQSDICGVGSSFTGTDNLTFSAGTLAPGGSCTFSVELMLPANVVPGSYTFVSSLVQATVSGLSPTSPVASDDLLVSGITFTKEFINGPFLPGQSIITRYTISNAATAGEATNLQFTDSLSQALSSLSATSLPSTPCGVGSTIAGTTFLVFSGGSLNAGESCSFDVPMLIPAGAIEGSYNSLTSDMSATVGGNNTSNPNALDILEIETLTVNISSANAPSTSVSPFSVNVDFSRDVVNFVVTDLAIGNGVANNFVGSGKSYTVDITPNAGGTVTIDLPMDTVDDAIESTVKNPAADTLSIEYAAPIPNATPSLVISNPSLSSTSSADVSYDVTYTDASEVNLISSSVSLNKVGTNADVTITNGTSNNPTIILSNITGDGTLGITINAGTARNGVNVAPEQGPSTVVSVDNTAPALTVSSSSPNQTNLPFVVDFDFFDTVLSAPDTTINGFSITDIVVTNGVASGFTGSGASYSATITPSGSGNVSVSVNAGAAQDGHFNDNTASNALVVSYDVIAPTVSITSSSPTVNTAYTATIVFSENVTGFTQNDLAVSNATLSLFNEVNSSNYTVLVTPINNGNTTLDLAANSATDIHGNSNSAGNQLVVSYDIIEPTVIITSPTPNANATFTATITFSEAVTGFDVSDLLVSNATLSTFNATSSSIYTVSITPTNNGTITVNVPVGVAQDNHLNANAVSNTLNISFDNTVPTVAISSPNAQVNSAFTATITFSEAVTGFDVSDLIVINGALSSFNASSSSVYTVTITPTNNGDVNLEVPLGAAQDAYLNANTVSNKLVVSFDNITPSVIISSPNSTVNSAFTTTVTFSEAVTGFDVSDLIVNNGTLSSFNATSSSVYTVVVTPSNSGDVSIDVPMGAAQDAHLNDNTISNKLIVSFDDTELTVTITSPYSKVNSAFVATIMFSESVSGFNVSDLIVNNGTLSSFSVSSSSVYAVIITPTNNGNVTVNIPSGAAQGNHSNDNLVSNTLSVSFDNIAPSVIISSPNSTVNSAFTATITFSEAVTGFDVSDLIVSNGTLSSFNATSSSVYTVVITPTNNGGVSVDVAAGAAKDSHLNDNTVSNKLIVSYDNTEPSVMISSPSSMVNSAFTATIIFSEAVTGFDVSDLIVNNSTLSSFSEINGSTYTVLLTPVSNGEVNLSINAGAAINSLGNNNQASNKLSVNYDASVLEIVSTTPQDDDVNVANDVSISFTFNKDINAVSGSDKQIQIFKEGASSASHSFQVMSNSVEVESNKVSLVSPLTLDAGLSYYVLISAGSFVDNANNSFTGISDAQSFNFSLKSDSPVAQNEQVETKEDELITIDVLLNDTDINDSLDPQTIVLIDLPENGTAKVEAGKVIYQPDNNFYGTDSFNYTVSNVEGLVSNEASVDINIVAVNDIPLFTSSPLLFIEPLSQYVYKFEASDVDFDVLTFDVIELPSWLVFDGVDTLSGTPAESDLDNDFSVVISLTDNVIDSVVEQEFSILVTNDGLPGLKLSQRSSVNPVLVGTLTNLIYQLENKGVETVLLDELVIELIGDVVIENLPSACSVNNNNLQQIVTCELPSDLEMNGGVEFTLSVLVSSYGDGEITSKMTVVESASDIESVDTMFIVVSEEVSTDVGELLSAHSTSSHALGDLNGDGLVDLVIGNLNLEPNQVFFNVGAGKFELSQSLGDMANTRDITLVDLDNDNALDVVVANSIGFASGYYLNSGDGTFDEFITLGYINSSGVAFGDFDNDGLVDLAFSNSKGFENSIFMQPFTPVSDKSSITEQALAASSLDELDKPLSMFKSNSVSTALVTGDFNGDGHTDIVFGYLGAPLRLLLNDGNGTFSVELLESYSNVTRLMAADINNDSIDDIFVSDQEGTSIVYGGNLVNASTISSISAIDIVVADIDNNDVIAVLLLTSPGVITKYTLNTENQFIRSRKSVSVTGITGLGAADIDGDDDIDLLLTSNATSTENEIRYNQGSGNFGAQTVDLGVSLESINNIVVNNNYQVTLELSNSGFADAQEVSLDYSVTNGTIVSITDTTLPCEITLNTLMCNGLMLAVDDSKSIVLNLSANTVGVVKHVVAISTTDVDDNTANNQASTEITVNNEVVKKKKSGGSIAFFMVLLLCCLALNRNKLHSN